jgi:hypothetical protein
LLVSSSISELIWFSLTSLSMVEALTPLVASGVIATVQPLVLHQNLHPRFVAIWQQQRDENCPGNNGEKGNQNKAATPK